MLKYKGQKLWYHALLIKTLEYVVATCKANNICYWLYAGTLLGAVRHGGMIPWDIDIDIAIFHSDAERLIRVFSESEIEQNKTTKNDFSIMIDRGVNHTRIIRLFYSSNTKAVSEKYKKILNDNEWAKQWGKYYNLFPIHVDIMPWYVDGDKISSVCVPSKIRPLLEVLTFDNITFEGRNYSCPHPPESGLVRFFGEDYMTPKTNLNDILWVQKFDSGNEDIFNEIKKYISIAELNELEKIRCA